MLTTRGLPLPLPQKCPHMTIMGVNEMGDGTEGQYRTIAFFHLPVKGTTDREAERTHALFK